MGTGVTHPLAHPPINERTIRERDDAGVVDHLVQNHDVFWCLQDAIRIVVARGKHGARDPARDAPVPDAEVLIMVTFIREVVGFRIQCPLLNRSAARRRVDDERGLPGRQHRVARVEPVAAIPADVGAGLIALRGRRIL